jgi:hypothetical protein
VTSPDGVPAVRYVPLGQLAGRHVIVDGAPRPSTSFTLSHWPATPTPRALWHDLSAGIVLEALRRPELWPDGVEVASIDHYDTDGVIALALLCVQGLADTHAPILLEAARVGDFGVVRDRRAALVAFALAALGDPSRSGPLGANARPDDAPATDALSRATTAALDVLPSLLADAERHEGLWGREAGAYDAARRALIEGWAWIEERAHHDLAVLHVDVSHPDTPRAGWNGAWLHPAAVHSATTCLRVLTVAGRRYELRYRYESWVRLASGHARRRVDLAPTAEALNARERDGARWVFDGAGAITGALRLSGDAKSSLEPQFVVDTTCQALEVLDAGPPAWDPYAATASG